MKFVLACTLLAFSFSSTRLSQAAAVGKQGLIVRNVARKYDGIQTKPTDLLGHLPADMRREFAGKNAPARLIDVRKPLAR